MGRPPGAAGKKTGVLRSEVMAAYKVSEGYIEVYKRLKKAYPHKTGPDLLHEAMRDFAFKNLNDRTDLFWIKKIM